MGSTVFSSATTEATDARAACCQYGRHGQTSCLQKHGSCLQRWQLTPQGFARTWGELANVCFKILVTSIAAFRRRSTIFHNCLQTGGMQRQHFDAKETMTLESLGCLLLFLRSTKEMQHLHRRVGRLMHEHTHLPSGYGSQGDIC